MKHFEEDFNNNIVLIWHIFNLLPSDFYISNITESNLHCKE